VSSREGADALARGLLEADPDSVIETIPIADGGEGTLEALAAACASRLVEAEGRDPLDRPCRGAYLALGDGATAVVELARCSGLTLLAPGERDPSATTTYGTGLLVGKAIADGARRVILAVGGSATNDAGMGICAALGVAFLDARGEALRPCGASLARVRAIDARAVPADVKNAELIVATDVRNPLHGPEGAACMYAPQKGADPAGVRALDEGLRALAGVLARYCGRDVASVPGTGAAGGVGAGLAAIFGARIESGFDTLAALTELERRIARADVVITGEGRVDAQTLKGKAPFGVARLARRAGVPVLLVGGAIEPDAEALRAEGVVGFFPIVAGPMALDEAMARAGELLRATGRRIGFLLAYTAESWKRGAE
jgi:glycerate 2-kinase